MVLEELVFRRTLAVVLCRVQRSAGHRIARRYWEQTDVVTEPSWDLAFASDLMAKDERLLGLQIFY